MKWTLSLALMALALLVLLRRAWRYRHGNC